MVEVEKSDMVPSIEEQQQADKSRAIRDVINAWKGQAKEERNLRTKYANYLIWTLIAQAAIVNIVFLLIGSRCLSVDEWTARTFIMAVFAEIVGLVIVIVNYLFRDYTKEIFGMIDTILTKDNRRE